MARIFIKYVQQDDGIKRAVIRFLGVDTDCMEFHIEHQEGVYRLDMEGADYFLVITDNAEAIEGAADALTRGIAEGDTLIDLTPYTDLEPWGYWVTFDEPNRKRDGDQDGTTPEESPEAQAETVVMKDPPTPSLRCLDGPSLRCLCGHYATAFHSLTQLPEGVTRTYYNCAACSRTWGTTTTPDIGPLDVKGEILNLGELHALRRQSMASEDELQRITDAVESLADYVEPDGAADMVQAINARIG